MNDTEAIMKMWGGIVMFSTVVGACVLIMGVAELIPKETARIVGFGIGFGPVAISILAAGVYGAYDSFREGWEGYKS